MTKQQAYQQFYQGLQKHLPKKALPQIIHWLMEWEVHLHISKPRSSKLGDYRPPQKGHGHRISVNGDLNPYTFLQVLVHELAHLVTYNRYKRKVAAHGKEWQQTFRQLMQHFLGKQIFPDDLETALAQYMQKPAASSCVDVQLVKAFKQYDQKLPDHSKWKQVFVEEVEEGMQFVTRTGRVFKKGKKLRKRYRCLAVDTKQYYAFSPVAAVYILKKENDV